MSGNTIQNSILISQTPRRYGSWFCNIPVLNVALNVYLGYTSEVCKMVHFVIYETWMTMEFSIILYNEPTNARNNFTNYHTATCFDTIVSSSGSLQSIPCQVTSVFQMQLLVILSCTMKQQIHAIISQIITLLHVSKLSCHPQAACNQYLAKLHQYFKCSCR